MNLPFVTLPSPLDLLRIVGPFMSDDNVSRPWCRNGEIGICLSRSTWSLRAVADAFGKVTGRVPVTVWVPSYFCESGLAALRLSRARLVFYPVTAALEPNLEWCRARAREDPPDLFVLVHYFGRRCLQAAQAAELCRRHGSWLVEDAAHVLRPEKGIGNAGDLVLYSPHKLLPVPDGAVLVARPNGPALLGVNFPAAADALRQAVRQLGTRTASTWLWYLKRSAQLAGWRARLAASAEEFLVDPGVPALPAPQMSPLARRLLVHFRGCLDEVSDRRLDVALACAAALEERGDSGGAETPFGPPEAAPYAVMAAAQNETAAAQLFASLRRKGWPAWSWPDLPPEVLGAAEAHYSEAIHLRRTQVFAGVHQGLSIRSLAQRWQRPMPGRASINVQLDAVGANDWSALLARAGRSSLLQSWAWGDAKASVESWVVHRAVFLSQGQPVAIAQVLGKSAAGVGTVWRVNRGPVFLRQPSDGEMAAVLSWLRGLGRLSRMRAVFLAPELERTGANLLLMARLGFRPRRVPRWCSAWVSLGVEEDALRAHLDGKWRNQLGVAERSGMVVEGGSDAASLEWLMERHEEAVRLKGFGAVSKNLVVALSGTSPESLTVWRGHLGGEVVAGLCVARHGRASTYLVGWSGDTGRAVYASNLLLWQAVLGERRCGTRWFDVGGIDRKRNPGVASFKAGLRGEAYELLGEYWHA